VTRLSVIDPALTGRAAHHRVDDRLQANSRSSEPEAAESEAVNETGSAHGSAVRTASGALQLDLFGYSTLRPGSMNASAFPALALSLKVGVCVLVCVPCLLLAPCPHPHPHPHPPYVATLALTLALALVPCSCYHKVHNPTAAAATVDFLFALPAGAWTDCSRRGDGKAGSSAAPANASSCMHLCHATASCASWQFSAGASGSTTASESADADADADSPASADASAGAPASTSSCVMNTDVPLTAHWSPAGGGHCGVKGQWTNDPVRGLTYHQTGNRNSSAAGNGDGPSIGDMTLLAVVDEEPAAAARYAVSDSGGDLFAAFESTGGASPSPGSGSSNGGGGGSSSNGGGIGGLGAASVSATVPAGGTRTLTVVFSWHFPHRDYTASKGAPTEVVGNYYKHLWADSAAAASELAAPGKLAAVVRDLNAHHGVIAHRENPAPDWLKDMLVNQVLILCGSYTSILVLYFTVLST
jgi:hypothetical protein